MVSANDDFSVRIERLERDVRRLVEAAGAIARPEDPVDRLSFRGWLKVSGPTFAVMVFGFGLLRQAQQANTAQLMELSRSTNAQIAELSRSTNEQLLELSRTVGRLEGAIGGLTARVESLETAVAALAARVDKLDVRLDQLGAAIEKLADRVDRLDAR